MARMQVPSGGAGLTFASPSSVKRFHHLLFAKIKSPCFKLNILTVAPSFHGIMPTSILATHVSAHQPMHTYANPCTHAIFNNHTGEHSVLLRKMKLPGEDHYICKCILGVTWNGKRHTQKTEESAALSHTY